LYQGSSTLLFGAKNFEISTIPRVDEQGNSLDTYFTPDKNKFKYLEKSFNLKADIVDSSHSNNVVIGNFVNDYMESPFKTVYDDYRSCLSGYPCLLFMKNNVDGSDNSHYIYLGIYNVALNRSSTNNLGYTKLITSEEY